MSARPWLLALLALLPAHGLRAPQPATGVPRYAACGALRRPSDLERWVLVGASTGLAYGGGEPTLGPGEFHTVHLEPAAYAAWRAEGRFPDGTMLALVIRSPARPGPPGRAGWVAGELGAVEVAVKDTARFAGGWGYFGFGRGGPGTTARPFPPERCAHCHAEHGALDNVFLQFYPVLREARPTGGAR